ncbi:MAG: ABC transporter permease [Acidimicrobiia bacterium]|nr:ABC transporter permease [Acidimicrobiia bacterium]
MGRDARPTRRLRPVAVVGLALTALLVLVAVFADQIAPSDPFSFVGQPFEPPSSGHWLGTDDLGRDVFSGIVHGARTSLVVGVVVAGASLVIGTVVGGLAGFIGGWVDDVLMRFTELVQVMPRFFLALMVVALFGPGLPNLIAVLALTSWEVTARVARAGVLAVKELDYVLAARALGASSWRNLRLHALPNAFAPVVALAALQVGGAILIEAGLSFLGLGDPNVISWGYMLNNAQAFVRHAWWMSLFPGAAVALAVLGVNLLGDALNDRWNPRSPTRLGPR